MAQLTISIPDDLKKRLKETKGTFNVSAACQRAIGDEIEAAEMSISVPRRLMQEMNDSPGRIAWSQVACQAFEERLLNGVAPTKPQIQVVRRICPVCKRKLGRMLA
jgi:hypothetical protein